MRSLNEIKKRRTKKGDTSGKSLKITPDKKSIPSVRAKKDEKDIAQKLLLEKEKHSKKYDKEIELKRKTSISLQDKVDVKTRELEVAGSKIIEVAKKTASVIVEKAKADGVTAQNIKSKAFALRKRWRKRSCKQKDRNTYLNSKEKRLSVESVRVQAQKKQVSQDVEKTKRELASANELLVDLGNLFLVAIDKVNLISEIEGTTRTEVEKTLLRAEKLYNEIERKERGLKAERENLDEKDKELDIKAAQVADQVKSLKMVRKIPGVV